MFRELKTGKNVALLAFVASISLSLMGETSAVSHASPNVQVNRVASFADQAGRGHDTYTQQCSTCHQEDLSGTDMVPALAGPAFLARWQGKTAKDLFDRTSSTMPASSPASLPADQYMDLTAYILQVNGITPPKDLAADNLATVAIHE